MAVRPPPVICQSKKKRGIAPLVDFPGLRPVPCRRSMAEMPGAGEDHGQAFVVGGLDDVFVAHAAAGLDDGGGARFGRRQKAVGEGEEGVRRHHRTDGAARGVAPDPDTNGVQGF